jgi:hypothetical protein
MKIPYEVVEQDGDKIVTVNFADFGDGGLAYTAFFDIIKKEFGQGNLGKLKITSDGQAMYIVLPAPTAEVLELQKLLEEGAANARKNSGSRPSGLRIEKSSCCGASITHTRGGMRMKICSNCRQPVKDIVFK